MAGQATLTIRSKQWSVSIASASWELTKGLGGIPQILPQSGMLFDLGFAQTIQVTTVPMLFALDIAFLSETLVITEVYRNIQAGYLVTSTLPARYFLEVNAGELEGIDSGDQASVEILPPLTATAAPDWASAMFTFMGFVIFGVLMVSFTKDFVKGALGEPKEKLVLYGPRGERLLPQTKAKPPKGEGEVMEYRVEENKPYGTWAIVELWSSGTVRSPFESKEEAIKREEEIGEWYGWKLRKAEFTPEEIALLDPQRFPKRTEALHKLRGHDVIHIHDDGDLTVRSRGKLYVATTEGQIFGEKETQPLARPFDKPKVIPTTKPKRKTPSELEYFVDSPEFLTQTIDAIGYRDRIDNAFQEAIARAGRRG